MNGPPAPAIVIIGYGNTLRGDDGVGPWVAEAVATWRLPGVRALAVHQLTPELAESLADADLAIFVDARLARVGEAAGVEPLEPAGARVAIGHISDMRALLSLARAVYGRCPRAWSITVPATNLALGAGFSPSAECGIETALRHIALLVKRETAEWGHTNARRAVWVAVAEPQRRHGSEAEGTGSSLTL